MRINHNISALKANNQLRINNNGLDKSLERLSSGYRINRAADDAAGMAISQKMRTQIRGLEQASRNAADGISVIQTAEGALVEVESMLQRMRELAVQAKNGTNTLEDREDIQLEIDKLNEEIQRVSDTTEFNKMTLLNGDIDRKTYSNNIKVKVISMSDSVEPKEYKFLNVSEASKAHTAGAAAGAFTGPGGTVKGPNPAIPGDKGETGTITVNGQEMQVEEGDTWEDVVTKLRDVCSVVDVNMTAEDGGNPAAITDPGVSFVFDSVNYGREQKIYIECDNADLAAALGISAITGIANTVYGTDASVTLDRTAGGGFSNTASVTTNGNEVTISDVNGFELKLDVLDGAAQPVHNPAYDPTIPPQIPDPTPGTPTLPLIPNPAYKPEFINSAVTILDAGPMNLQVGANEGQLVEIRIPKVTPKTLGIEGLNVRSEEGASKAIGMLDGAVVQASAIRAKLGAYQNRLDHTISNLDVASENLTEALARIEDTDMAEEMANFTQKQVLTQANTSMLAQANERPQTILSLLQG